MTGSVMGKGDIKCDQCNGARLVKMLISKMPCYKCNGAGVLKANMEPYTEFDVIRHLLGEVQNLNKKNYLLRLANGESESSDQHDGRSKNSNYRGD
ncbi:heat shock protein DnaJ [Vibrio phage 121E34-1]|nr:heat shock protein DnaJ [Vibrio phage 131E34-1]CAH9012080.1 heat shock protein DnaJ [Vibrio phage 121E34-1]